MRLVVVICRLQELTIRLALLHLQEQALDKLLLVCPHVSCLFHVLLEHTILLQLSCKLIECELLRWRFYALAVTL